MTHSPSALLLGGMMPPPFYLGGGGLCVCVACMWGGSSCLPCWGGCWAGSEVGHEQCPPPPCVPFTCQIHEGQNKSRNIPIFCLLSVLPGPLPALKHEWVRCVGTDGAAEAPSPRRAPCALGGAHPGAPGSRCRCRPGGAELGGGRGAGPAEGAW